MTREELVTLDEVGGVIADSIIDFFAVEANRTIVQRLKEKGVRMEVDASAAQPVGDKLKGKTFVVSGVFQNFSRDGVKEAIERNGGKVSGAISSKTSFVLQPEPIWDLRHEGVIKNYAGIYCSWSADLCQFSRKGNIYKF